MSSPLLGHREGGSKTTLRRVVATLAAGAAIALAGANICRSNFLSPVFRPYPLSPYSGGSRPACVRSAKKPQAQSVRMRLVQASI